MKEGYPFIFALIILLVILHIWYSFLQSADSAPRPSFRDSAGRKQCPYTADRLVFTHNYGFQTVDSVVIFGANNIFAPRTEIYKYANGHIFTEFNFPEMRVDNISIKCPYTAQKFTELSDTYMNAYCRNKLLFTKKLNPEITAQNFILVDI